MRLDKFINQLQKIQKQCEKVNTDPNIKIVKWVSNTCVGYDIKKITLSTDEENLFIEII